MFIRNCPSKELSLLFLSKPQREWTASQVQERLDEFLREHKTGGGRVSQHVATTANSGMNHATAGDQPSVKSSVSGSEPSTVSDGQALEKIQGMLEKALVSNAQSVLGGRGRLSEKHPRGCKVCQSTDHSTTAHCKLHKLCFQCFAPGHTKAQCQANTQPQAAAASGTAQADRLLNYVAPIWRRANRGFLILPPLKVMILGLCILTYVKLYLRAAKSFYSQKWC